MKEKKLSNLVGERARNGFSQSQMADKIGMTVTSYWRKENGLREFTRSEIYKIAEILHLDDKGITDIFFS